MEKQNSFYDRGNRKRNPCREYGTLALPGRKGRVSIGSRQRKRAGAIVPVQCQDISCIHM